MKKSLKLSLTALATLVLTACNSIKQNDDTYETAKNFTEQALKSQELSNSAMYNIKQNGIYVDKTPIDSLEFSKKQSLPKKFYQKQFVNHQEEMSANELAAFLSHKTKLHIVLQQEIVDGTFGTMGTQVGSSTSSSGNAVDVLASVDRNSNKVIKEIRYEGTTKGLLDHVASQLNVNWKYENGAVEFFKFETKMFSLDVLSGTSKLSANLNTNNTTSASSSESGSSQETTSGQQTQIDNTVSIWEEVGRSIQGVLSENEKFSLTPSAGKIIVMASPNHMRKVENILKQYNSVYSRLVRLDVRVYQVEQNNKDNYGINWGNIWKRASDTFGVTVSSGLGASSGAGLFTVSNTRNNTNEAIFEALSSAGKTSLLRNNSVVTLNNQTVPLSVAREVAYVQSTKVSTNDSSSSTEINPGVVTEGFAMNLTPLVNDKGEVLLQYSVDSSTIEAIVPFSAGGNSVELPRRTVNNFLQRVAINNGESVVLTGFQEVKGAGTDSGPLNPNLWFLGGSRESQHTLKTIVVVITPYILK